MKLTFYDQGDGGGKDAGTDPDPKTKSSGADDRSAGDKGNDPSAKKPGETQKPDFSKMKAPEIEKYFGELDTKYSQETERLKKKLGDQSGAVGAMKAISQKFKADPEGAILEMAKQFGVKVTVGDQTAPPKSKDVLEKIKNSDNVDDSAEGLDSLIDQRVNAQIKKIMSGQQTLLSSMVQEGLKRKYPDFDDLADDRDALLVEANTGVITHDELLHLAAMGRNVPAALEAYGKQAVEEYKKSLSKKVNEQPGTGDAGKPGDNTDNFGKALAEIQKYSHRF